jgi:hypothetical protein
LGRPGEAFFHQTDHESYQWNPRRSEPRNTRNTRNQKPSFHCLTASSRSRTAKISRGWHVSRFSLLCLSPFSPCQTDNQLRKAGMWFVNGKVEQMCWGEVEFCCGWEDRALQECNLSAQPSVDCGSIRSRRCLVVASGSCLGGVPQQATVESEKLRADHTLGPAWLRAGQEGHISCRVSEDRPGRF